VSVAEPTTHSPYVRYMCYVESGLIAALAKRSVRALLVGSTLRLFSNGVNSKRSLIITAKQAYYGWLPTFLVGKKPVGALFWRKTRQQCNAAKGKDVLTLILDYRAAWFALLGQKKKKCAVVGASLLHLSGSRPLVFCDRATNPCCRDGRMEWK
jgi:hypothetical protein